MSKNQFLELFSQLNAVESKEFSKYVVNQKSEYKALMQFLLKNQLKPIQYIKTKTYLILFKNLPYNDVRVRLVFSDLLTLFKDYLPIAELKKRTLNKEITFLKFLRNRKIDRLFDIQYQDILPKLSTSHELRWDENKYQLEFDLAYEKFLFDTSKNRFNNSGFFDLLKNYEIASLIEKFKIYLEHLSFVHFRNEENQYPFLENEIQQALKKDWQNIPELQVYVNAVLLFLEFENNQHYLDFIILIERFEAQMEFDSIQKLYSIALNYCIRKINFGDEQYFEKTLLLYKKGVEMLWILENGKMSSITYKNIISLCIRMKNYNLAETLLEEYKPLVHIKEQENIYQFNLAKIYKEKRNFKKALLLLNTNRYKDPLIELNARIEMIKIYAELNESDLLENQIQSTQNFIKKFTQFGYHKTYYANFLKFTKLVYKNSLAWPQTNMELVKNIQSEERLIERNWLLHMLNKK